MLSGKKKPQLRNYLHQIVCKLIYGTFLINDWHGKAQPTVGSTTSGKAVLYYKANGASCRSKLVSGVPLQFLPQFLLPDSCLTWVPSLASLHDGLSSEHRSQSPFLPKLLWVSILSQHQRASEASCHQPWSSPNTPDSALQTDQLQ